METRRLAIFRINYKSDFILTLQSDAGWGIPFCIKFWTDVPSQAYFAGWDGTTYTNCAPVEGEPSKLQVQFDDHHLAIGELKYQIGYHFTVDDFPTTVEDEVINQGDVIIDNDGRSEKVLLDFNGETAPDIQFSLPAYASEAQRIANEEQRIENEQQRISNEETRILHEWERQRNEQTRIAQEEARERAFTQMQRDSESATRDANDAATLANSKARLAQEKAEYAQQQGDFAKAQGETAQLDHTKAAADHQTALADHQAAAADHQTALADHQTAAADHQTAESDHTRAGQDHTDIQNAIAAAELVYDISKAHASGGVLATYADLSAALGTNGANVPVERRQGGMVVQFVRSSDNNYVQYRYMLPYGGNTTAENNKFVNVGNWQGVDDKPTAGSRNLVKSGGIHDTIADVSIVGEKNLILYSDFGGFTKTKYSLDTDGSISGPKTGSSASNYTCMCQTIPVNKGAILQISGQTNQSARLTIGITTTPITESNFATIVYDVFYNKYFNGECLDNVIVPYDGYIVYYKYTSYWDSWYAIKVFNSSRLTYNDIFDVSKYNNNALYYTANGAISAIPANLQEGGMTIQFVKAVLAIYSVVKTEGLETAPTGTEVQEDLGLNNSTYLESSLSAVSTLPSATGDSVTYYMEVEGESTTYTSWVITKDIDGTEETVQYRLLKDTFSSDINDWEKVGDDSAVIINTTQWMGAPLIAGGHLSISNGYTKTATSLYTTILYYINCKKGDVLYCNLRYNANSTRLMYFYITSEVPNKTNVAAVSFDVIRITNTLKRVIITAPVDGYIAFVSESYYSIDIRVIAPNLIAFNNVNESFVTKENCKIIANPAINDFGQEATFTGNWQVSSFIDVSDAKYIRIPYYNTTADKSTGRSSNPMNTGGSVFYDENKNPISVASNIIWTSSILSTPSYYVAVPNNAKYIRISCYDSTESRQVTKYYNEAQENFRDRQAITFVGQGNQYREEYLYNIKAGHTYRVWIKNPNISMDGITYTSSSYTKFRIVLTAIDGTVISTVGVGMDDTNPLPDCYDVTVPIPAEGESAPNCMKIVMRAAVGEKQVIMVEDITFARNLISFGQININELPELSYWINDNNRYGGSSIYKHVLIDLKDVKWLKLTANSGYTLQYAWFTEIDTPTAGGTPPLLDGTKHTIGVGKTDIIEVPNGAKYLYVYTYENGTILPQYVGIYPYGTSDVVNDSLSFDVDFNSRRDRQVTDMTAIGLSTLNPAVDGNGWELPATLQQLNVQRKSEQLVNIRWTPKKNVPAKNGDAVIHAFPAGVEVTTGIPYSSNNDDGSKTVGEEVTLYTFMTALNNPYSLIYTECVNRGTAYGPGHSYPNAPLATSGWGKVYTESGNGFAYYGTVCCGLTSSVENSPLKWNNPVIKNYKKTNGVYVPVCPAGTVNFELLRIGDVCDNSTHSFVIYGLHRDANGLVDKVTIAESSSSIGKGGCRTYTYATRQAFVDHVNRAGNPFTVFRYMRLWDNTDYEASEFVPLTARGETDNRANIVYNDAICTFAGDKATFRVGDLVVINYNINGTQPHDWTKIKVYKDDVLLNEYTLAEAEQSLVDFYANDGNPIVPAPFNTDIDQHNHALVLGKELAGGLYKACMSDGTNDSDFTYWEVLSTPVTFVRMSDDKFVVTVGGTNEIQVVYVNSMYYLPTFEEQTSRVFTIHPISLAAFWDAIYDSYSVKFKVKGVYGNASTVPVLISGDEPEPEPDDDDDDDDD